MGRQHGGMDYFISGKGVVSTSTEGRGLNDALPVSHAAPTGAEASELQRKYRFATLFPDLPALQLASDDGLVELGNAMFKNPEPGDDSSIDSGYTYLGQFIAHDLSFDRTIGVPDGLLTPAQIEQGRSPAFDLDSLYGDGPESGTSKGLYQDDHIRLVLRAMNRDIPNLERYDFDLPRNGKDTNNPGAAITADERNDDNLAVAQMTVAFIKFHNAVVDHLAGKGFLGTELFKRARETVVRHYQWIVLNDYLKKIVERSALDEALTDPPLFPPHPDEYPFMPVEFSFAAFRFGHCMIRDAYEWNDLRQKNQRAKLHDLISHAGNSTEFPTDGLDASWVIDWRRFFDFQGFPAVADSPLPNKARKISPYLTSRLKSISEQLIHIKRDIKQEKYRSLPVLDLIRGWKVGLPSGQSVAKKLRVPDAITPKQISDGPHANILLANSFDTQTPLWYYILREAEIKHGGDRLGPVGSRLVAKTFVGIIRKSSLSILADPPWHPDGELGGTGGNFTMVDLLSFAGVINPLGRKRVSRPATHRLSHTTTRRASQ